MTTVDKPTTADMTAEQHRLIESVHEMYYQAGGDMRDHLTDASASYADKAAVADYLGGAGAGDEFRDLVAYDDTTDGA